MTAQAPPLNVLSAGAAQGLVTKMAPRFLAETGVALRTAFGAVGAIREKLFAGEPCDALILTEAMIRELQTSGHVAPAAHRPLGRVRTGIAVRAGEVFPDISEPATLKQNLLAATEIFLPDPQRATAGIHFARVLQQLGIYGDVAAHLRAHPNGAAAMRSLAETKSSLPIGCTQISEIRFAEGVDLVGPLPSEFELATTYSIAVCAAARQPELAQRLAQLLTGTSASRTRTEAGFET